MQQVQLILGLLVAVSVLAVTAQRLRVPYPIALVLGGLLLSFVPGLPRTQLAPDVVFVVFLPPLVHAAASSTSLRELRANARPIVSLALGLALATVAVVAVVAHLAVRGMTWQTAFVLGAIVAPTDPIAVAAIIHRLGAPRRVALVVESESLVNDAVGLVAYRIAVAAAVAGSFSPWHAGLEFVLASAGGIAVGLAVGWSVARLHRHIDHTSVEITLTLLTPFAAYLPAAALGVSGVLAVMAAGIYLARRSSVLFDAEMRLESAAVWEILVFALNGLLFILLGLQLHGIANDVASYPLRDVVIAAATVCVAVIAVRPLWAFPATYLPGVLSQRQRLRDPAPPWQHIVIVSWSGMRGSASIAAALAVPLVVHAGSAFPQRSLIVFVVFCVILSTLVLEGLSLPRVIRRLGVSDDGAVEDEEQRARLHAAQAALDRIERLAAEEWVPDELFAEMESRYRDRIRHLQRSADHPDGVAPNGHLASRQLLQREALAAERAMIVRLRDGGQIGDEVLRRLERELDLQEQAPG